MPEVKNTFIKSKMNKDLDSRLIPNGEYRDGQNISVSKSEGDDVGAIENIRGNIEVTDFGLTDRHLEIIGIHSDIQNNRIFCFITNYSDSSDTFINHSIDFANAKNYIVMYDFNSSNYEILVQGNFLNLSKTHPVYGVNVLENLLFWTDNRNQPRKINITKAISSPSYYNTEDLISVLKYAPVDPVKLVENKNSKISASPLYDSTTVNDTEEYLPQHFVAPGNKEDTGALAGQRILIGGASTGPRFVGVLTNFMSFQNTTKSPRYYIKNITRNSAWYTIFNVTGGYIKISQVGDDYVQMPTSAFSSLTSTWGTDANNQDTYAIAVKNPYYDPNFRGDKDFLKDKFVRFSYRFKFEDGEYSLMAPFTQPAYLSKQAGNWLEKDEEETKESGIVKFFENQITTIGCCINLPYDYDLLNEKLNISAIDILYKDSNSTNISVLETIQAEDFNKYIGSPIVAKDPATYAGGDLTHSSISYDQTTASLVQGLHYPTCIVVSGNGKKVRLEVNVTDAAGNLINGIKCTSSGSGFNEGDALLIPANELGTGSPQVNIILSGGDLVGWTGTSPNFSPTNVLKNQFVYKYRSKRPYKVLPEKATTRVHDKAPVKALSQEIVGNRILYGNYVDRNNAPESLDYSLKLNEKFNLDTSKATGVSRIEYPMQTLKQNRTYQVGVVLVDRYGRASNVLFNEDVVTTSNLTAKDSTIFSGYSNYGANAVLWPGNSLKVIFNSVIPNILEEGGLYSSSNPLGWYSYRIVVKQQDQDYYNVYVPGVIRGNISWVGKARPNFLTGVSSVSNIALHGDNINKIPRNLTEVGPLDENFGSDTVLYARVNPNSGDYRGQVWNTQTTSDNALSKIEVTSIKRFKDFDDWAPTKGNFYPGQTETTGSSSLVIAPWYPYNVSTGSTPPTAFSELYFGDIFYKPGQNPFIATLANTYSIGTAPSYQTSVTNTDSIEVSTKSIGIFETKPVVSNLNILWETTTSGLISDLNLSIQTSTLNDGLAGVTEFAFIQSEDMVQNDFVTIPEFEPVDSNGNTTGDSLAFISLLKVLDGFGNDITYKYQMLQTTAGVPGVSSPRFRLRLRQAQPDFVFKDPVLGRNYTFYLKVSANGQSFTTSFSGSLINKKPYILSTPPYSTSETAKITMEYSTSLLDIGNIFNKTVPGLYGGFIWDNPNFFKRLGDYPNQYAYWELGAGYKGNSILIHNFHNNETWLKSGDPPGTTPKDGNYYASNLSFTQTTETYTLQNGTSYSPGRKDALKVKIKKVQFIRGNIGNEITSNEPVVNGELPFVVTGNGRQIETSKLNPPNKAGNYYGHNTYWGTNATYVIKYVIFEDCVGGQESQEYDMYVRFYLRAPNTATDP